MYHATSRDHTEVAIKAALNRSARDLAHLRREKEVVGHLSLPGIRDIRHVGQSADGHIYSAMEWAERSLREEMKPGRRFSRAAVLKYLLPVAQTMDEMHARQFIHCNVTPDHILLMNDGRVLLAGLAQARRRGQHPAPGDPRYSAPERNTAQPTGPWSDIYSLGVIAYEMLTGELPFTGATDDEVRRDHAVLSPSLSRGLRRSLGRDASRALLRALAKEPADRFHSATVFLEALREQESTSMRLQHSLTDLGHGLAGLAGAAPRALKILLLVLVGGAAAAGVLLSGTQGGETIAEDPRTATAQFLAALETPVSIWTPRPVHPSTEEPTADTEATPSPSLSPTPTHTPGAATPTPEVVDTPTPVPVAAPDRLHPAPELLQPADVTHFQVGNTVDLAWSYAAALEPGESFDIRMWKPGEPAWGIARSTETSYRLHGPPAGAGEYTWVIVVVKDDPATGKVIETSKPSGSRRVFWD